MYKIIIEYVVKYFYMHGMYQDNCEAHFCSKVNDYTNILFSVREK